MAAAAYPITRGESAVERSINTRVRQARAAKKNPHFTKLTGRGVPTNLHSEQR
jgi:hypothetical protein